MGLKAKKGIAKHICRFEEAGTSNPLPIFLEHPFDVSSEAWN